MQPSMLSGQPFELCGDADPMLEDLPLYGILTVEQHEEKTIAFPELVDVPQIDSVPPSRLIRPLSPLSPISISTTSSSEVDLESALLSWTNADLIYLLGILYSDLSIHNQLSFSPPLEDIHIHPTPIHLTLHATMPVFPIPPEAYSSTAPIGTGRPISKTLLAESARGCRTPAEARKTLARDLLRDFASVNQICAKYNVLAALYSCKRATLESLKRGMEGMAAVEKEERWQRRWTMREVDGGWELGARIELFLLESGSEELETWRVVVEMGLGLDEEERRHWGSVYETAGRFLRAAILSLE